MKNFKGGFTLIEILLWISIVSMVLVVAFQALAQVSVSRTKLVERSEIYKDSFHATELLFTKIKSGGTIDYEEYFNRSKIWLWVNANTWHYTNLSMYWNTLYSNNLSWKFDSCMRLLDPRANNDTTSAAVPKTTNDGCAVAHQQKFWNYARQFFDYDIDWDWNRTHDGDWNITDDNEILWIWPDAISDNEVAELYLIDWSWKKRTYFRWKIERDDNRIPSVWTCNTSNADEYCVWNLQYIVLEWKDWWSDHIEWTIDSDQYDWIIDTWIVSTEFTWGDIVVANYSSTSQNSPTSNIENYWVNLFPDTMSVTEAKFEIYPKKSWKLSWDNVSTAPENISPYVRVKLKIQPSWVVRKFIIWRGKIPQLELNSTINLNWKYFVNE